MTTRTTAPSAPAGEDQRARFYRIVPALLAADPRLAVVLADIGVAAIDAPAHPDVAERIINVGIREQLLLGVAGGLALTGHRPVVHTFAPFLLERPFEQVKLDLGHQGVGAVLVSSGGSYGWPEGGQTHFGHRDVALLDTLEGWTVHVAGHPDEAEALLRCAAAGDGTVYVRLDLTSNRVARPEATQGSMLAVRCGRRATVVAVGPMLDRVLEATHGLDVTVLYATTVRPLDVTTLRATLDRPDVVVVEPYLAGTSAGVIGTALRDVPHRVLALGVGRADLHRYGTVADHDRAHGLDAASIRASVAGFLAP